MSPSCSASLDSVARTLVHSQQLLQFGRSIMSQFTSYISAIRLMNVRLYKIFQWRSREVMLCVHSMTHFDCVPRSTACMRSCPARALFNKKLLSIPSRPGNHRTGMLWFYALAILFASAWVLQQDLHTSRSPRLAVRMARMALWKTMNVRMVRMVRMLMVQVVPFMPSNCEGTPAMTRQRLLLKQVLAGSRHSTTKQRQVQARVSWRMASD